MTTTVVTTDTPGWVLDLVVKHPWIASLLLGIGILRLIFKPFFTFLHAVVLATPTTKDDEWLARVEASPALKWLSYLLDYLGSIKLTHPKAQA